MTKTLALFLASACLLTSCSKGKSDSEETTSSATESITETTTGSTTETTTETTTEPESSSEPTSQNEPSDEVNLDRSMVPVEDELASEIKALPGVVEVSRFKYHSDDDEYVIFFEMPVDHKDPSKGIFRQRVNLKYRGKDAPNLFTCTGYDLVFPFFDEYPYNETNETILSEKYECNFIEAEYRFYGQSTPEGYHYTNPEHWPYLTNENASEDLHTIIESLKKLLSGKWLFEGNSKGGCLTVYQAGRHPEDADLFIAECAMVKCTQNYPGLYEYCYTKAGDERFGKEIAREYRDLITEFQVECIRYREKLMDKVKGYMVSTGSVIDPDLPMDILYDCLVLDQIHFWQYCDEEYIALVKAALAYKDVDKSDYLKMDIYMDKLFEALLMGYGPWQYQIEEQNYLHEPDTIYQYNFQNYREDGSYLYDFSYLREALKKDGSGLTLTVTEDMEPSIHDMRIAKEQRQVTSYFPDTVEARLKAIETTQKPLILINGLTDIHSIAEVTESDNPNVYIFNIPGSAHHECEPDSLSDSQFQEFDKIVKGVLENK